MLTKTSQTYKEIRENAVLLVSGTVLSIDPSIGSYSSMPGWAVYEAGELVESGRLELDPSLPIPLRLSRLVRKLALLPVPDILVYEKLPVSAHGGGRSQVGHASLLMALGATLSVYGELPTVGIMPISWKKLVRPEYVKGDEADAIEIGHIVVTSAKDILLHDPPGRKYGDPLPRSSEEDLPVPPGSRPSRRVGTRRKSRGGKRK